VLLCTGMIDQLPELDGLRALWGTSVIVCPYCHGWEVQDRAFGLLALDAEMLEMALLLCGWSRDVVALTDGKFAVPAETRERLGRARVWIDERRIARLAAQDGRLARVEFAEGSPLPLEVLFTRPRQSQVPLVSSLGLAVDRMGYLAVDEMRRETSIPGIHAGGDLVMPAQSAILAAASGTSAAAALNHALTVELALDGALA
jgi:thioredoxin reductase